MAWNESRLWMIAPGWRPNIDGPARLAQSSAAVSILSFKQQDGMMQQTIHTAELIRWLKTHGFKALEHGAEFLGKDQIEVSIEKSEDVVSSIRLTFTIFDPFNKRVFIHDRLNAWMHFVSELTHVWNFRLLDPKKWEPIADTEFKQALCHTPACEGITF